MVKLYHVRIPASDRNPDYFYYEVRHHETDWTKPILVERGVWVNFYGTIVSDRPILIPSDGYLTYSQACKQLGIKKGAFNE